MHDEEGDKQEQLEQLHEAEQNQALEEDKGEAEQVNL